MITVRARAPSCSYVAWAKNGLDPAYDGVSLDDRIV